MKNSNNGTGSTGTGNAIRTGVKLVGRIWGYMITDSNNQVLDTVKYKQYSSKVKARRFAEKLLEGYQQYTTPTPGMISAPASMGPGTGMAGSSIGMGTIRSTGGALTTGAVTVKPRTSTNQGLQAYEGGSTRSAKSVRYDLVPPELEEAVARRFAVGSIEHGDNNWRDGGADFILSCINHGRSHIASLIQNGPWHEDDDIGAILWNFGVLAWFRAHKPEEFKKALAFGRKEPVK